jgi:hypothetical protein
MVQTIYYNGNKQGIFEYTVGQMIISKKWLVKKGYNGLNKWGYTYAPENNRRGFWKYMACT